MKTDTLNDKDSNDDNATLEDCDNDDDKINPSKGHQIG